MDVAVIEIVQKIDKKMKNTQLAALYYLEHHHHYYEQKNTSNK